MAESLLEQMWALPGSFCLDALVEDDTEQEGERIIAQQLVRGL